LGPNDKWRCISSGTLRQFVTTQVVIRYYSRTSRLRAFYTGQVDDVVSHSEEAQSLLSEEPPIVSDSILSLDAPEQVVDSIICHFGSSNARRYRVRWADGDETIEPLENLVDTVDDEEIVNIKLEEYRSKFKC